MGQAESKSTALITQPTGDSKTIRFCHEGEGVKCKSGQSLTQDWVGEKMCFEPGMMGDLGLEVVPDEAGSLKGRGNHEHLRRIGKLHGVVVAPALHCESGRKRGDARCDRQR